MHVGRPFSDGGADRRRLSGKRSSGTRLSHCGVAFGMARYELLFIVDAKSDLAARRAADAAWKALDSTPGATIKDCSARRRARNGRPVAVDWKDWQESPEFSFRVID